MRLDDGLTERDIVRARLHHQRLSGAQHTTPADAVGWLGAVQAQEYAESLWSIGQRVQGSTEARVAQAFDSGEILRTHLLRPTWHAVRAEDIRWMLELSAPRVHQLNRYWHRRLELDAPIFTRSSRIWTDALHGGGSLTRVEIARVLRAAGITAHGLQLGYLLMHAELDGLICSGPRRGSAHTYALLDERVAAAPALGKDEALARLCLQFFRGHGPATRADFMNWSSLTAADTRVALDAVGPELSMTTDDEGRQWWSDADTAPSTAPAGAFLIPMYDETIVAYKDLRVVLAGALSRVDILSRAIVIDGYTVGSWKRELTTHSGVITATLFTSLTAAQRDALEEAVVGYGHFLGLPLALATETA